MITWLIALSRGWIKDVLSALAILAAGIQKSGDDMVDSAVKRLDYRCTYCISCTVLAAGILEGGDDMADSAVKRLDYRWTYCISCTASRHTER